MNSFFVPGLFLDGPYVTKKPQSHDLYKKYFAQAEKNLTSRFGKQFDLYDNRLVFRGHTIQVRHLAASYVEFVVDGIPIDVSTVDIEHFLDSLN